MAILLMILGALSACAGVAAIAYGMPIKEFSLGNTMILSGTTAAVGGVLIIAIGVAVRQLREIADGLASRPMGPGAVATRADLPAPLAQVARPAGASNAPGRVTFPTRPKLAGADGDSKKADGKLESAVFPPPFEAAGAPFAPAMEDERPAPIIPPPLEEIVPEPLRSEPALSNEPALDAELRTEATIETDQALQERREAAWHEANEARAESAPQEGFDSIWDRDARPVSPPAEEPRAEAPEFIRRIKSPPPVEPRPGSGFETGPESRSAPILKSGVVDGMGYTLYVDGSIEAELPQGTVRFASIAELREHLEKNG